MKLSMFNSTALVAALLALDQVRAISLSEQAQIEDELSQTENYTDSNEGVMQ